ncbi:DUF190 domain-containing protein, partial [Aldersonia kunmingensis]|uniref:DUF190 domain-containing protein n=1 Tax=Aldersonia kunmingensis TaxID=408066 RepID=UPI000A05FA12
DALLDLYGRHEVACSVMLRGISGFGLRHHIRTDQSLSLSEDPPVTVIAVDTQAMIEHLVDDALDLTNRGMLTLERARFPGGDPLGSALPEDLSEAAKLTVYLGRQQRIGRVPAYVAITDLLHRRGFAGASVYLGVDGTMHGRRVRARFFSGNANVPMLLTAAGTGEQIAGALGELGTMLDRPLVTVERIRVCKRRGELVARPHSLPAADAHGVPLWQKLTVYTTEDTRHDGKPIHRELIRRLRHERAARGATSLRAIRGFHDDRKPHGDTLFRIGRQVPVTTIVVDTPENIARSFDIVDELTSEHGLVTSEMVPALIVADDDENRNARLARYRY